MPIDVPTEKMVEVAAPPPVVERSWQNRLIDLVIAPPDYIKPVLPFILGGIAGSLNNPNPLPYDAGRNGNGHAALPPGPQLVEWNPITMPLKPGVTPIKGADGNLYINLTPGVPALPPAAPIQPMAAMPMADTTDGIEGDADMLERLVRPHLERGINAFLNSEQSRELLPDTLTLGELRQELTDPESKKLMITLVMDAIRNGQDDGHQSGEPASGDSGAAG